MEVLKILTKSPQALNSLEEFNKTKTEERYVYVFIGSSNSTYWSDIELLAMVSERPVYFTSNDDVKKLFSEPTDDTFISLDTQTQTWARLKQYPEYAVLQRFISTSTSDVPLDFNIDNLRQNT